MPTPVIDGSRVGIVAIRPVSSRWGRAGGVACDQGSDGVGGAEGRNSRHVHNILGAAECRTARRMMIDVECPFPSVRSGSRKEEHEAASDAIDPDASAARHRSNSGALSPSRTDSANAPRAQSARLP